jgi:peptidoglycan-associated lipoprotein
LNFIKNGLRSANADGTKEGGMKRMVCIIFILMFLVPGMMLMTSCSKKVVKEDLTTYESTDMRETQPPPSGETVERGQVIRDDGTRGTSQEELAARQRFMNEDIYFSFDQSSLSAEAQQKLRAKAQWLRSRPGLTVVIEGHCDERGTTEYNLALGDRRAESAKSFLVNLGISGSRMTTVSYGEEKPADPGHTEAAWARNRRAHFVIE